MKMQKGFLNANHILNPGVRSGGAVCFVCASLAQCRQDHCWRRLRQRHVCKKRAANCSKCGELKHHQHRSPLHRDGANTQDSGRGPKDHPGRSSPTQVGPAVWAAGGPAGEGTAAHPCQALRGEAARRLDHLRGGGPEGRVAVRHWQPLRDGERFASHFFRHVFAVNWCFEASFFLRG